MKCAGTTLKGTDEAIGHVEDFIVDDETWEVRYLVIDTSNWWFGKKVLVAPEVGKSHQLGGEGRSRRNVPGIDQEQPRI